MTTQPSEPAPPTSSQPRYVDIGINLTDPMFRGRYRGHRKHDDDLADVVDRARQVGCTKLMVTGSDIFSSRDALKLSQEYPGTCYATAGIHPCSSAIFGAADIKKKRKSEEGTTPRKSDDDAPMSEEHLPDPRRSASAISQLTKIVSEARSAAVPHLVAMGEFGLDYDRLNYCNKVIQKHSFAAQLELAASLQPQLPLFLHSRAAHADFVSLLKNAFGNKLEKLERGGVVHSFTGTLEEMQELMELGLYIGINGCSFKTAENCEVVRGVSLDRIMIETDGPWCEIRPKHAGYKYLVENMNASMSESELSGNGSSQSSKKKNKKPKKKKKNQKPKEPVVPGRFDVVKKGKWRPGCVVKGRNESSAIERVAEIVAAIKGVSMEEVQEAAWRNSIRVFGLDEKI